MSDLFLFDTKTKNFGGSGKHFDWNLLKKIYFRYSFIFEWGISSEDIAAIKALNIHQLIAIDVNSKVEISPGIKDVSKVKELILKNERRMKYDVNEQGFYGDFGGAFIPEMLHPNIQELKALTVKLFKKSHLKRNFLSC